MDWKELWREYQNVAKELDFEPTSDDLFSILKIAEKRRGFVITQSDDLYAPQSVRREIAERDSKEFNKLLKELREQKEQITPTPKNDKKQHTQQE